MSGKLLVLRSQSKVAQDQQLMERAENLALDKHEKIIQEIKEGSLKVNRKKTDLNSNTNQSKFHTRSKSVPHLDFPVPEYNSSDAAKIKEMILKQRQRQEKLEQKARELEQKVKMDEVEAIQKAKQEKNKKFQQKKIKVLESIEQIKQRHENRKKRNVEENSNLIKLKSTTTLHEKLEEKWKKVQQKEQQQKEKIKILLHQAKKVSFEQIKQHAIRHDQNIEKIKQSRIAQSRISKPEAKKFYQSVFLSRVVEQDRELQDQSAKKKKLAQQFAQKKQQYAQIVRQNYKPKINQSLIMPVPVIKSVKSLSHLQTFQRGNSYMKEVNEKLNIDRIKIERKASQDNGSKQFFKYKNYLTEIREKKNATQANQIERSNTYQKEIKKIMESAVLSEQEKFIKAKFVAKRMESVPNKKNPKKLIESINAKIEILKHVSG